MGPATNEPTIKPTEFKAKCLLPGPFTAAITLYASTLPSGLHDDPGDRLLVATARALGLASVTRNREILDHAGLGHVKAVPC